jgi:hypothetical protein
LQAVFDDQSLVLPLKPRIETVEKSIDLAEGHRVGSDVVSVADGCS